MEVQPIVMSSTCVIKKETTYLYYRRKTPGVSGNRKALEVNLPESSRKFITCIRKYLLFYLKLLEETGDICTLERAYISLRADKRVTSMCFGLFLFNSIFITHTLNLNYKLIRIQYMEKKFAMSCICCRVHILAYM